MNIREAIKLAFGTRPSEDLNQYYAAWQWLHDHKITLGQSDRDYLQKLIDDGIVIDNIIDT